MPYGSVLHIPPTNYHVLAAKQEPYLKAYLLTKTTGEFSRKKVRRTGFCYCGTINVSYPKLTFDSISWHCPLLRFERIKKKEVGIRKADIFVEVRNACKAIFWHTPGFIEITLDSSSFCAFAVGRTNRDGHTHTHKKKDKRMRHNDFMLKSYVYGS